MQNYFVLKTLYNSNFNR